MTSSADRTPEDASSRKNSDKREKSKEDSRSSSSHKIGKASSSSSISSTSLGNTFGSKTDCRGKKSPKREDELSDREDWNRNGCESSISKKARVRRVSSSPENDSNDSGARKSKSP